MKNSFYEGYKTNIEVINLLVFKFLGELVRAAVKPGSWIDSQLASSSGLIFPNLIDYMKPPAYEILVVSSLVVNNG